jgi:predicted nucleic acid-binding Zn ribbon protein
MTMALVTLDPNRYTRRCAVCGKKFTAIRTDAMTCSPRCRVARHRRMQALTPPWPEGRFDLLMVDLPLAWLGWSPKGEGRSPQHHYATLDIPAVVQLLAPLFAAVAAKNAVCCWWVYGPRVPESLHVLQATGWTYTTELLVWEKVTKAGEPRMGNGKSTRKVCEIAWGCQTRAWDSALRQRCQTADRCTTRHTLRETGCGFLRARAALRTRCPAARPLWSQTSSRLGQLGKRSRGGVSDARDHDRRRGLNDDHADYQYRRAHHRARARFIVELEASAPEAVDGSVEEAFWQRTADIGMQVRDIERIHRSTRWPATSKSSRRSCASRRSFTIAMLHSPTSARSTG